MSYEDGPSPEVDRPPHVRAASGLTVFSEYLAVVQDDANWLALIDSVERVHALPLPPAPESGARVFSDERGNKHEKFDLEACIALPGEGHGELIGFGSGSHKGREWILRIHESSDMTARLEGRARHESLALDLKAEFLDATAFYDSLRQTRSFAGAGINIEGAISIGEDTIRLFQRGNAPSRDGLEPVDSTGDISWSALRQHLSDPTQYPPPEITNIRRYDLGELGGVRLTFSDAEYLGEGRVLYSASAEDPESDRIAGSVLGLIEADGRARYTEVIDKDGTQFSGKIEGLTRQNDELAEVRFVIDDDDETLPSVLYEADLSANFFH